MNVLSSGVIVPLITPFHFDDIYPLIDYIIKESIDKIFILGTTGEGTKLDQSQKITVIRSVASFIGNRAQLLVGINSKTLQDTLELIHISNEVGAYTTVIAPLLMQDEIGSLISYFLSNSPGNIVLYNNPSLTKNRSIPISQLDPFLSEKRILGIKDSSGDLDYLDQLLQKKHNSHWKVFYGREKKLTKALERNIDGIVSGCGNISPRLISQIWESRDEKSWNQWHELKDAIKKKNSNYLIGLKAVMQERGLITSAELLN